MAMRRLTVDSSVQSYSKATVSSAASTFFAALSLLTSCTGERPASPAAGCATDAGAGPECGPSAQALDCVADAQPGYACAWGDGGCHCLNLTVDLPPVASLHFQIQTPQDDTDYPYGPDSLPAKNPLPGSPVYLSSAGSADPQGGAVSIFWNVQDPSGAYLAIAPDPAEARVSFTPSRIGTYKITLLVTEVGGLHQTGQASLDLPVIPNPCAPDGFSAPCSDVLPVAGGQFYMGSPDDAGSDDEHPRHLVTVAPFLLDKYEVTVGRFRRYIDNYGGAPPADGAGADPWVPGSGWQKDAWSNTLSSSTPDFSFSIIECGGPFTAIPAANEARPVTCVSWYEAFAMCVWEGKRLPTEEEWEYAAAGGSEQRIYPWGNDPPNPQLAIYGCFFDGLPSCTDADLPVVGSVPLGAGRWGQLDLAGSVWEWTLDMYDNYTSAPCDNCANITTGMGRVFRGGDYIYTDTTPMLNTTRYAFDPLFPDFTRGFRCAQSLPDAGPPVQPGDGGGTAPPNDAGGSAQPNDAAAASGALLEAGPSD